MWVKKARPLPIECIVRGYISGSAWKDYQMTGEVSGHTLPAGLRESDKLEEPIFTPSTKAEQGRHDENITPKQAAEIIGRGLYNKVCDISLSIYKKALSMALSKGIIIADTKFEFGLDNGELILIDELLTPDSSRFWPQALYKPGGPQSSYDKQFVRDYLESIHWNKQPPPPGLPEEIIRKTREKYQEAVDALTKK
jgi:phosphoribosylaminoimidazole-succinocarboxamide synthase